MRATATSTSAGAILPLRDLYRREMNCQIVHDSIHRRSGWTSTYALSLGDMMAGFGSIAIGGPWVGQPTLFEFYVLPEFRGGAFHLFEALLDASGARLITAQSNDPLLPVMLHTYARDIGSGSIVFRDGITTALTSDDAILEQVTQVGPTGDELTFLLAACLAHLHPLIDLFRFGHVPALQGLLPPFTAAASANTRASAAQSARGVTSSLSRPDCRSPPCVGCG